MIAEMGLLAFLATPSTSTATVGTGACQELPAVGLNEFYGKIIPLEDFVFMVVGSQNCN